MCRRMARWLIDRLNVDTKPERNMTSKAEEEDDEPQAQNHVRHFTRPLVIVSSIDECLCDLPRRVCSHSLHSDRLATNNQQPVAEYCIAEGSGNANDFIVHEAESNGKRLGATTVKDETGLRP